MKAACTLARHPWVGDLQQGVGDGLVVGEDGKTAAIQHVLEVSDARETGKKLPVKSRVHLLSSVAQQ